MTEDTTNQNTIPDHVTDPLERAIYITFGDNNSFNELLAATKARWIEIDSEAKEEKLPADRILAKKKGVAIAKFTHTRYNPTIDEHDAEAVKEFQTRKKAEFEKNYQAELAMPDRPTHAGHGEETHVETNIAEITEVRRHSALAKFDEKSQANICRSVSEKLARELGQTVNSDQQQKLTNELAEVVASYALSKSCNPLEVEKQTKEVLGKHCSDVDEAKSQAIIKGINNRANAYAEAVDKARNK